MTSENMPKKSNTSWYIGAVVIIIVIVVVGVLAYQYAQPPTTPSPSATPSPSTTPSSSASATPSPSASGTAKTLTIYAGEITTSQYGFGDSANTIKSPGPSFTYKVGDVVTVTFHNAGAMMHNFAIVTAKADGSTSLAFPNAQVASASSPVAGGGTGSVTFTVTTAGTFYYICQVDAHVSLGMWGTFTVTP